MKKLALIEIDNEKQAMEPRIVGGEELDVVEYMTLGYACIEGAGKKIREDTKDIIVLLLNGQKEKAREKGVKMS